MSGAVVYVVAKAPWAGAVKTRLLPAVTPVEAAGLARAFLLDTLVLARRARGVTVRAVCRDAVDATAIRELGRPSLDVLCQREPGLGAALEECFRHGLADGFGAVAVLGSDSPTLPPSVLEVARSSRSSAAAPAKLNGTSSSMPASSSPISSSVPGARVG